jgi:hypothetical protein
MTVVRWDFAGYDLFIDIDVIAIIEHRRWSATLHERDLDGEINTRNRTVTLDTTPRTGNLDRRWKGTL